MGFLVKKSSFPFCLQAVFIPGSVHFIHLALELYLPQGSWWVGPAKKLTKYQRHKKKGGSGWVGGSTVRTLDR